MTVSVESFHDPATSTWSHIAWDPAEGDAIVVDPVLDYDPHSGRTDTTSAARVAGFIRERRLQLHWIVETHAHADHLSGAQYLKTELGAPVAIGEGIRKVQQTFAEIFNLPPDFPVDGSQFDRLLADGQTLQAGTLAVRIIATPGHTGDSISLGLGDAVFVGDTFFGPDYGTARCDFPGGDARTLYRSLRELLALPDETRLYLCHDYPPAGQPPRAWVSVAEQRSGNVHVGGGVAEDDFVAMRERRDRELDLPCLLLPAIQVNIRAGLLPDPEDNGVRYLKIPLDRL